jgi:hypothetical protein
VAFALALAVAPAAGASQEPPPESAPAEAAPLEAAPPDAAARPPLWPRLSLHVGAALAAGTEAFTGQRRFTEFAEEGRVETDYARALGPGLDVGFDLGMGRHLGVGVAYTYQSRGVSARYDGRLPHPLYLARPRQVSGTLDELGYAESAVHLALHARQQSGRLRYGLFAGPTWAHAEPEVVERIQYRHAYPYDAVEVTGVPRARASGRGFGFNVGGTLEYRAGRRLAAALLVRYYGFTPELPEAAGTVELDGGGLLAGAALRLFLR